jgi:hypothetical protein
VVSLDDVTQVKLLDPRLDAKLRQSLEKLAGAAVSELDDGKRAVQLRFAAGGEREVRAGYLQEAPVWKTSYRLVLDDKAKPYLQGWAQAENTTDEDWKDVHLSLISGRPVSFIQNLYQPLYITRPTVAAQVVGSPLPQTYAEGLVALPEGIEALTATDAQNANLVRGEVGGRVSALENRTAAPPRLSAAPSIMHRTGSANYIDNSGEMGRRQDIAAAAHQLAKSVASQAQGSERGELFEYSIKQPVTLARGQATLVPIVSQNIEGELLSIYDVR